MDDPDRFQNFHNGRSSPRTSFNFCFNAFTIQPSRYLTKAVALAFEVTNLLDDSKFGEILLNRSIESPLSDGQLAFVEQ